MSDLQKKKKKAGGKAASPGGKKKGSKPGTAASKGEPSAKAAVEEEKKRLQAELGVLAATRAAQDAAAKALEEELAALRQRHTHEVATATDVLASQQRRQQQAQEAARDLEWQLEVARAEAAALQSSLATAQAAAEAAAEGIVGARDAPGGELQRAMSQAQRQEERLEAQGTALEALRMRLQRTEGELAGERATVAALRVRAQSRSELRFIRGSPFLVHVGREKLGGSLPAAVGLRPGAALAVAGRQLVLALPGGMHAVDLASATWCPSGREAAAGIGISAQAASGAAEAAALSPTAVTGRSVCSVGSKLLGFGGECQGRLLPSSTQFLHPDLQAWLPAPAPADAAAPEPPPRTDAALAYCPRVHAVFMYGGQGEGGSCIADLWRLDLASMVWTRLDKLSASRPLTERARSPCMSEAPPAAAGAALAVAPDASRLWLLGGRLDSGRCCNTLHWFDLTMNYWAAVEAQTWTIDSRSSAVMCCVGRYLLVAGGLCPSASGQAVYRQDCVLYDPAANSWDIVSDTAFEPQPSAVSEPRVAVSVAVENGPDCGSRRTTTTSSTSGGGGGSSGKNSRLASAPGRGSTPGGSSVPAFLGVGTCVFHDSKLLVLKAGAGGGGDGPVSEVWAVELQLPSAIEAEQLRSMQRTATFTDLTLKEVSVGITSVQLSWRAPTAGADKLLSFKLMMTIADGRAREAYEGRESSCEVTGLMPSSQYVFCVKALFDDTTFLWSEPMMITTKKLVAGKTGTTSMGTTAGSVGTGVQPVAK